MRAPLPSGVLLQGYDFGNSDVDPPQWGGLGVVLSGDWINSQIHGAVGGSCVGFPPQGATQEVINSTEFFFLYLCYLISSPIVNQF